MSEPKGTKEVTDFLKAKRPISAAKEDLPSTAVHREAILHAAMQLQDKVEALEAKLGESTPMVTGPQASTSREVPSNTAEDVTTTKARLNAATPAFEPKASTSEQSVAANSSESGAKKNEKKPEDASQASAGIKKPGDKLCHSMWGKKQCLDRATCEYKHLALCHEPACYGNAELRKACSEGPAGKWHGHIRALINADKRRERLEADRRDFAAWQKAKQKGNKAGGNRGAPHHKQPPKRPQAHPVSQGQGQQQAAQTRSKYPQKQKKWPAQARKPLSLGDYMPAPIPVYNAWEKPLVTSIQQAAPQGITGPGARQQQMQALLQTLVTLLQSGPC